MVVLESMTMGRPVLVNGKCQVLKDHCIKSDAGLYFESDREFERALEYLLSHEETYCAMCHNAKIYVDTHYQWDIIIGKIRRLIEKVTRE